MKNFEKSLIQGGKIAKYRAQHQCITFATDTEQNNKWTFQMTPKNQKTPHLWFLLLIKFPKEQAHLDYLYICY